MSNNIKEKSYEEKIFNENKKIRFYSAQARIVKSVSMPKLMPNKKETPIKNFDKSNFHYKNISNTTLPFNFGLPIIHTYAIPSKLQKKIKSESTLDLAKFTKNAQSLLNRFNNARNIQHIVKIQRKGIRGCKRLTIKLNKILKLKNISPKNK